MCDVIVLTYKGVDSLRLVLEGLTRQTCKDFLVRVVNDGGDRATKDVVDEFRDTLTIAHYYLEPMTTDRRLSAARNLGAEKSRLNSKPSRILFMDGDCIPSPEVVKLHKRYAGASVIVCGVRHRIRKDVAAKLTTADVPSLGNLTYSIDDRFLLKPKWRAERYPKVVRMMRGGAHFPELCHGFQVSYPMQEFNSVGGYWTQLPFRQDQDIAQRLVQAGCSTLLEPKAICYHLDHAMGNPEVREMSARLYAGRWGNRV